MHYITDVHYESDFKLRLQFEDEDYRMVAEEPAKYNARKENSK